MSRAVHAFPLAAGASPAVRFPRLVAEDLNGDRHELPHRQPGTLALYLIAYAQDQQADVDPWLTAALRLAWRHPGLRVYELPTLSTRWARMRWLVDGGMRRGVRDRAARARTITLYLDKPGFNAALGVTTEATIHALLVDADGVVVWRRAGALDAAAEDALAREVAGRLGGA